MLVAQQLIWNGLAGTLKPKSAGVGFCQFEKVDCPLYRSPPSAPPARHAHYLEKMMWHDGEDEINDNDDHYDDNAHPHLFWKYTELSDSSPK